MNSEQANEIYLVSSWQAYIPSSIPRMGPKLERYLFRIASQQRKASDEVAASKLDGLSAVWLCFIWAVPRIFLCTFLVRQKPGKGL